MVKIREIAQELRQTIDKAVRTNEFTGSDKDFKERIATSLEKIEVVLEVIALTMMQRFELELNKQEEKEN